MSSCKFWVSVERQCGKAVDWTIGRSIDLCEEHARLWLLGIERAPCLHGETPGDVAKRLQFRSSRASR